MGNVGSHSEGEEEEEEEEERGATAAATAPLSEAAMDSAASASSGPAAQPNAAAAASSSSLPAPSSSFPPAAVLLGQARLREEAAARLRQAPSAEPLLSRHHGALVRWLEERLGRGEQVVSIEQLCEALESRAGPTQGAAATAGGGSGAAGSGSADEERARNEEVSEAGGRRSLSGRGGGLGAWILSSLQAGPAQRGWKESRKPNTPLVASRNPVSFS